MFSVSLFFIVLRKLSTRPKPQVSQERGDKNTPSKQNPLPQVPSSPNQSVRCSRPPPPAEAPAPPRSPRLQAVRGSAQPLSPPFTPACTTLCTRPRHPLTSPCIWRPGLRPVTPRGPLRALPAPGSAPAATAPQFSRKGLESGGPGSRFQLSHLPAQ